MNLKRTQTIDKPIVSLVETGSKDFDVFLELPYKMGSAYRNWVKPLRQQQKLELTQNPFLNKCQVAHFVCFINDEAVGRISASINLDPGKMPDTGYVGYFESIDNQEVADALFNAAESWIKEKGKTFVFGPINLSIFNAYRLQTDGFNTQPYTSEPRSPEYYQELFKNAGYKSLREWVSWELDPIDIAEICENYSQLFNQFNHTDSSIRIEHAYVTLSEEEIRDIYELIMVCVEDNFGTVRLSFEEYYYQYKNMIPLLQTSHPDFPTLALKAYDEENRLVAYVLCNYDLTQNLLAADGHDEAFTIENLSDVNILFTCVHPDHQGKMTIFKLLLETFKGIRLLQPDRVIFSLAKHNYLSFKKPCRSYAVFEKKLR